MIVAGTIGAGGTACSTSLPLVEAGDGGDGGTSGTSTIDASTSDAGVRIARTGFLRTACVNSYDAMLGEARPNVAVDRLEMRSETRLGDGGVAFDVMAKAGTTCSTATNLAACTASFENLTSSGETYSFSGLVPTNRYLAYTRGDSVGAAGNNEKVRALLQPFDVDGDGIVLLNLNGYAFDCSMPNVKDVPGGREYIASSGFACGAGTIQYEHRLLVKTDGTIEELQKVVEAYGDPNCAIGRLPAEYACEPFAKGSATEYLSRVAELEAASVFAFERLADELVAFGAPTSLIERARASAREEVTHAEAMREACVRFGGVPRAAAKPELGVRSLLEMALENATEGCVRETYGAAVAAFQSARAEDQLLRSEMVQIAEDEMGHAALSWEIHAWALSALSESDRLLVSAAQRSSVRALGSALASDEPTAGRDVLGLPSRAEADRMYAALVDQVWAVA